jgi:hypothetical protein
MVRTPDVQASTLVLTGYGTPITARHATMERRPAGHRMLSQYTEAVLPSIYTPAVGLACQHWGKLLPRPTGLYLSFFEHRGRVRQVLDAWPHQQVRGWPSLIVIGRRWFGRRNHGTVSMAYLDPNSIQGVPCCRSR